MLGVVLKPLMFYRAGLGVSYRECFIKEASMTTLRSEHIWRNSLRTTKFRDRCTSLLLMLTQQSM